MYSHGVVLYPSHYNHFWFCSVTVRCESFGRPCCLYVQGWCLFSILGIVKKVILVVCVYYQQLASLAERQFRLNVYFNCPITFIKIWKLVT